MSRLKLDLCLSLRRYLRDPHTTHEARRLARAKLRITQEQFVRVRLARRLVALLHDEERPFTADDHARIFDGIHEARTSIELWQKQIATLRARPKRKAA
jgi:hypothetical protein